MTTRRAIAIVTCMAWALWMGGMAVVLVLVQRLFTTDGEGAVQAAGRQAAEA